MHLIYCVLPLSSCIGAIDFPCPFCVQPAAATVRSLKELREHVEEAHQDKDKCCVLCAKECGTKEDIQEHLQVSKGLERG